MRWRCTGEGVVRVDSKGGVYSRRFGSVAVGRVGGFLEGRVGGERLKDGRQARHVRQSAR